MVEHLTAMGYESTSMTDAASYLLRDRYADVVT